MLYTGIDYHRKYSVVSTQDATGTRICEARIDDNEPAAFAAYFQRPNRAAAWAVRRGMSAGSGAIPS